MGLTRGAYLGEEKRQELKIEGFQHFSLFGGECVQQVLSGKKVRINQSNVVCQPASNCILTQCNGLRKPADWMHVDNFNATVGPLRRSSHVLLLGISGSLELMLLSPSLFASLLSAIYLILEKTFLHTLCPV